MKRNLTKISSYLLIGSLFLAIYIWSTVWQNAAANVNEGQAKISFLDVGQGDAALISLAQNQQILIDTGKPGTLLRKLGPKMPAFDREIEAVFISHPDNDHSGGFVELAQSYKVNKLYFNQADSTTATVKKIIEVTESKKIPVIEVNQGDNFYFDRLKIETLWPPKGSSELKDNDLSQVLRMDFEASKALFTGDIELKGQTLLMQDNAEIKADLLKFPHHGSGGALNINFLKKVEPRNTILSSGASNPYGHPAKTVLDGLLSLGINIMRTDQLGTIDFVAKDGQWEKK